MGRIVTPRYVFGMGVYYVLKTLNFICACAIMPQMMVMNGAGRLGNQMRDWAQSNG